MGSIVMHSLNRPKYSGIEAFTASVATICSREMRKEYEQFSALIEGCCSHYDVLASNLDFAKATVEMLAVPVCGDVDMVRLYDKQFVRNKGSKPIRDSVANASPNGLCPYCGQGSVHELDHYLPKRPFTGIAVNPANLVPACRDCNRVKSDYLPSSSKHAVLHPYFDQIFDFRWLYATISGRLGGVPTAEFQVRVDAMHEDIQGRLESHMQVFHLYDRYRVLASQSLNNFETLIRSSYGRDMSLEKAKEHLTMTAFQQSGGRENSWELALYEAMANDDWYLMTYLELR